MTVSKHSYCPRHTGLRANKPCVCPLICHHCGEALEANDVAPFLRPSTHRECAIRMIVGSCGHLLGTCTCHGGTAEDPEGMTKREAAAAATKLFVEQTMRGDHG